MKRLIMSFVASFLFTVSATAQPNLNKPDLIISTISSSNTIASGESVNVIVQYRGETISQKERVPAAIVLTLDRSGSMSEEINDLKEASIKLIELLDSSRDKAAVVVFSIAGQTLHSLSHDLQGAKDAVSSISTGGPTNIADGIEETLSELALANEPLNFAILFTDGYPMPNESDQKAKIVELLKTADIEGTIIHTVGLGEFDEELLKDIAKRTGGRFFEAGSSADLEAIFETIYQDQSKLLSTKAVAIHEEISPALRVVDQSFVPTFFPPSVDQAQFDKWLQGSVNGFYSTGALGFPTISELGKFNSFGYTFEVGVNQCPERDQIVNLRGPAAKATFKNGGMAPEEKRLQVVNNKKIKILRCGVYVSKEWGEFDRLITIRIVNSHPNSARNLVVVDYLDSMNFLPDLTRPDDFVPTPSNVSGNLVRWEIDVVPAQSTLSLRFPVKERPGTPDGEVTIQSDGAAEWSYQRSEFRVSESDVGFPELRDDLSASALLSNEARQLLERKIGHTVVLPSNSRAVALSGALASEGYLHKVNLPFSEMSKVPIPAGVAPLKFEYTGSLLFSETGEGFEVWYEYEYGKQLPFISTTPDFVPN